MRRERSVGPDASPVLQIEALPETRPLNTASSEARARPAAALKDEKLFRAIKLSIEDSRRYEGLLDIWISRTTSRLTKITNAEKPFCLGLSFFWPEFRLRIGRPYVLQLTSTWRNLDEAQCKLLACAAARTLLSHPPLRGYLEPVGQLKDLLKRIEPLL